MPKTSFPPGCGTRWEDVCKKKTPKKKEPKALQPSCRKTRLVTTTSWGDGAEYESQIQKHVNLHIDFWACRTSTAVKSYSYRRVNYVPVTQRAHMAPLKEHRDVRASSKAYVHLSPTPTQKRKVQNKLHTHIIVIARVQSAPRQGRGFSPTELLGKSQNSITSSFVVLLLHWSCAWAGIGHFCLVWAGSLPVSGIPVLTLSQTAIREGGDRDNSEQSFSNNCFLLEAYQNQTFICFLKTYGDKWVPPFYMTSFNGW